MKKVSLGAVRVILAPTMSRGKLDRDLKRQGYGVHGAALGRRIWLDPRVDFTDTIIHELIHVRHPKWEESRVIEETERVSKAMTWKDKARLLRDVCGSAHLEGEEP